MPAQSTRLMQKRRSPTLKYTQLQRFFNTVEIIAGGCWLWTGRLDRGGYAQFSSHQVSHQAHRWLYTQVIGDPGKLLLDHVAEWGCQNRHCVNVFDHIEPVTHKENMRRGRSANREKTHCRNGHEFSEENTYTDPSGGRHCRICTRASIRRNCQRYIASIREQVEVESASLGQRGFFNH